MPQDSKGRYIPDRETSTTAAVASAARTTTGNGTAFDTDGVDNLTATLVITAASGTTPTLDLVLQTTADGTNYYTVTAFPQQTTTNAGVARVCGPLGKLSRWAWTIGGTTPSCTFSVSATADRDD
jgi:hypothetical protein